MGSDMKHGCFEIKKGALHHYQSDVNMMKIAEQLLEHNDLLKKCVKQKRLKIRATAKECETATRIETS